MKLELATFIIMAPRKPLPQMLSAEDETEKVVQTLQQLRAALTDGGGFTSCHTYLRNPGANTAVERWRRVQFSKKLVESYREAVIKRLLEALPDDEALVPFSYEAVAAGQVPVLPKEEFPTLADWLDEVPQPDWNKTFDGNERFLNGVNLHVAVLGGEDAAFDLRVFRRRTATTLIKKQGILGSFRGSSNEFEIVFQNVYDFPIDAEFFEWKGYVYVLNITALEALTDIREITNTQAKKAIASIKAMQNLVVTGLDAVEKSLGDRPRLAKRLAAANKHEILKSIKLETISQHIDNYALPLTAVTKAGKLHISFDVNNRVHVEEFVNLVADVYLRSSSTGLDYKAHSKELYKKKR